MILTPRPSARRRVAQRDARSDLAAQGRIDRRREGLVEGAVARPEASAGQDEMVAKQAQRPGVEMEDLALLVEQRGGGADQFEAVGDAARSRAGEQRRQRRGGAVDGDRRASGRAVVAKGIGGRLHGGLVARRSCRLDRGGHGSLRSETERDFSAD